VGAEIQITTPQTSTGAPERRQSPAIASRFEVHRRPQATPTVSDNGHFYPQAIWYNPSIL